MNLKPWHIAIALFAAGAAIFGWLSWKCLCDPKINFLPRDHRADWIIFPAPINARAHLVASMDTTFRRTFLLESKPQTGRLLVRAAKRLELKINGQTIQVPPVRNWKGISTADASSALRSGENTIEARVFNDDAPSALWLRLEAEPLDLRTDATWQASLAGSSWRNCALASLPRQPGAGNLLSGGERISDVLPQIWLTWIGCAVFAVLLIIAITSWLKPNVDADLSDSELFVLLGVCSLAWAILFWNNTRLVPFHSGYDSTDHIAYIKYIQDRKALPLPNEGYEMFQPPLYYALSAGVLSICRLAVSDQASVAVLRTMTMIFGVANFVFVSLCLRLLFPRQRWAQIIGLVTAAFLPMQLYLSHYVTNETLSATLVSAAIYFALLVFKSDAPSPGLFLTLGIFTGLAMLAKATSVLLLLPLLGALMMKLVQERARPPQWCRAFGIFIAAAVAVSGWHYIRIWQHFGKPIVGNWEAALGFPLWQDPGFHTSGDYFRFGRALFTPLYSGFNGFADGIYSTLWGDSLGGGLSGLLSRTPWNYSLATGGYWIALVPTALVLIGLGLTVYRFTRKPSDVWFLLIGFPSAIAVALVTMTLRVPSYAQIKAFYGLSAVIPFCCFLVIGSSALTTRWRVLQLPLAAIILWFNIDNFAAVWVRPTTGQHIYTAFRWLSQSQINRAAQEADEVARDDPSNPEARCFLAAILDQARLFDQAVTQAEQGLTLDATNGDCHLQLAITLSRQGDSTSAINEARQALQLQPENARAYDVLFTIQRGLQQNEEALETARDALAISPFDADFRYRIGLAAAQIGDFKTALPQFGYAASLSPNPSDVKEKIRIALRFVAEMSDATSQLSSIASAAPDSPTLLNELAWMLATNPAPALRDGARAVELANRACALTERNQPEPLATAAAAYAEVGKFSEAIDIAQHAEALAKRIGNAKTTSLAENMLKLFQSNQPYREEMR